ncbi:hypothetical protein BH10ACT7_BH10ACT7_23470 [soil metagenome]
MRTARAVIVVLATVAAISGCAPSTPAPVVGEDGLFVVTPVVASVAVEGEWLTASGYIEGIAESGGKCSFTFQGSGGGASRLSSTAQADGSRTDCGTVEERVRTVFPGDYELTITYTSDTSTGTSEPVPVTVPEVD